MFLSVLVLMLLVLAIAYLLWYRAKAESDWLLELLYLRRHQGQTANTPIANDPNVEPPVRANITPERQRRQTQLHHQSLHEALSQQLKERNEQNKAKRKRKKVENTDKQSILFPDENDENAESSHNEVAIENAVEPIAEPAVISLDEATRLLNANKNHRPQLETVVLNLPSKAEPALAHAEEITADDPAVRHVLRRHQRNDAPKRSVRQSKTTAQTTVKTTNTANTNQRATRTSQTTNSKSKQPSGSPTTTSQPTAETISNDDIRSHLMRQRFAGRRQAQPVAPAENANVLPVIAEDEVRANLAKIDAPAARDPQRFARTVVRDSIIPAAARIAESHGTAMPSTTPIFTRFTPFERPKDDATPTQTGYLKPSGSPSANDVDAINHAADTPLAWENPNSESSETSHSSETNFRADPSLTEQVSTDIPYVELGDNSEWQQALTDNTPPEPQPVSASHVARVAVPELPSLPISQRATAPAATGYLKTSEYALPMAQLLAPPEYNPAAVMSEETLVENGIIIEEKLAEFRVKVKVVDAIAGPVITRYEIEPDVGVRGSSVINLERDVARSLGVAAIRVVETIPGKTCMGLELPNPQRQTIRLSEIFQSSEFEQSTSKLTLALGQDITGQPVVTNLRKAPHLLVAGTTGSGKSVGVNGMILSMLFKAAPEDVRLIMIDPKMLELSIYEGIPHLLAPVITDMKLAPNALTWCVNEMEKRYRLMSYVGVRNLESYNEKVQEANAQGRPIGNPFSYTPDDPEPLEKLPFIVVVVDEFADLMMVAGKQIEQLIARLAQKARAAGIHLILATQRPSVDVITGLIKANIPTRIAFQVSSKIDSRTILDQMGAENLLGAGDMLFLPPGTAYPQRIHGAFVADEEVHRIVEYLKRFGEPDYIDDILTAGVGSDDLFSNANSGYSSSERDPQFDEAVAFILRTQKVTISSIQRHLRIGYNKAADIVDQMQAEGIVSAPDTNGKRTILARSSNHEE